MKAIKTMFAMMMAVMSLTMTVTACSSDDDEPQAAPGAAKSIEGVYTSDMTCTVMGQESTFENITFTLKATGDDALDINISAYGNPPMAVPAMDIKDVKVSGTDGSYTIAPTQFSGTTDAGKAYSGTLQGTFANNTLTISFQLQYGAMPMPMINTFKATKK